MTTTTTTTVVEDDGWTTVSSKKQKRQTKSNNENVPPPTTSVVETTTTVKTADTTEESVTDTVRIDARKVGAIVGKGGSTLHAIQDKTGVKIDTPSRKEDEIDRKKKSQIPSIQRSTVWATITIKGPKKGVKIAKGAITSIASAIALIELVRRFQVSHIIPQIQPLVLVLTLVMGVLLFGERMSAHKAFGGALIILGVWLMNRSPGKGK